ncbi:MAG: chromosomal replication initiator protein DnaA [Armatimonadetes bacterium]|nr:chromosomal replication initiator protein DnaA [Armatimonadota bacterium]
MAHSAAPRTDEIWAATLHQLRSAVSDATYLGFLRETRLLGYSDGRVVLGVPNTFARDWLQRRYMDLLRRSLSAAAGREVEIQWEVIPMDGVPEEIPLPPPAGPVAAAPSGQGIGYPYDEFGAAPLNPRYTFDNFVVADCNRFAHAAAMQVAKAPGESYNPLFIHSKAGLGKTHLMQALGHLVRQRFPHAQVVYVSAENFVNHMISAIRENTVDAFRARYRRVDVWLVDDIQFIAAIEGPASEEEFFHTFNTLYETNKQVVIASDAPPRALRLLNDRLRSRLEMGIVADLRCPDVETRIAILEKKAAAEQMELPREVLELVAKRIESNIRVLEGALTKICAYASLTGEMPSVAKIEELIADYSSAVSESHVSMPEIVDAVAERLGVSPDDVRGPKRHKEVAWARQVAIYLCRELTDNSLAAIGHFFAGRDHSTVLHSYRKVADLLTDDRRVLFLINELKSQLTAQ